MKKIAKYISSASTDWVIMNAKSWLPGKQTVESIIKENGKSKSVIMVCLKGDTPIFVLGSGSKPDGQPNQFKNYKIDTGLGYKGTGKIKVQNYIIVDKDGSIKESKNDIGLKEKRIVYVFK